MGFGTFINVEIINGTMRIDGDNRTAVNRHLSSSSIEKEISTYTYTGQKRPKDSSCENFYIPPMMESFYLYLYKYGSIPTETQFINEYKYDNCDHIRVCDGIWNISYNNFSASIKNIFIESRLVRTYSSLIRDVHFYYKLLESGKFKKVIYSVLNDSNGTDITVITNNGFVADIDLHVKTKSSVDFYDRKNMIRHDRTGKHIFDVPLDFFVKEDVNIVGNIFLYSDIIINKTIDSILESSTQ